MKKTFAWILSCIMVASLLFALPILSFADEPEPATPTPVYYPNGTVYLNETMIAAMSETELADAFKTGFGDGTPVWNAETGKLEISTTTNTFMDIHAVDPSLVMENYTISADLCVKETTFSGNVLMGMGINSASADGWNHGFYWQCNLQSSQTGDVIFYINNYNKDSININGGGSSTKKIYATDGYKIGETVIHVEIHVGTEMVVVTYDENDTLYFTIAKDKLAYATGLPFFMIRGNTTLAVDNLLIYSGTGDADPEKTLSNTQPIAAPENAPADEDETGENSAPAATESQAPATSAKPAATTAPITTAAPETTAAPSTETDPAPAKKGGCSSTVGAGLLSLVLVGCFGGAVVSKKKH